jgi:hypothetical protein
MENKIEELRKLNKAEKLRVKKALKRAGIYVDFYGDENGNN